MLYDKLLIVLAGQYLPSILLLGARIFLDFMAYNT